MHLGMTGRFTITQAEGQRAQQLGEFTYEHGADAKHDHVVFTHVGRRDDHLQRSRAASAT